MKTAELTGVQLDYWVAKAAGMLFVHDRTDGGVTAQENVGGHVYNYRFAPSTDWSQGGLIIKREWRPITAWLIEKLGPNWRDGIDGFDAEILRWFMRGFVGSKFGDEVPDEKGNQ